MKIVGLTGRSGCGKSTVSAYYRSLGYPVEDADLVARQVLCPGSCCVEQLAAVFGKEIIGPGGEVQRRLLADKAFAMPNGSQILVDITHPEITRRLLDAAQSAKQQGSEVFFVDGAVIVGAPFEPYCDEIILVTAPFEQSVQRICARDGISEESARKRLNAQLTEETLRAACRIEICNDGDLNMLLLRAEQALKTLKGGM